MSKSFVFYPDLWSGNKALMSCSMAAKGLWISILALSSDDGYLAINGKAIDDICLSRLVGEDNEKVVELMKELGSVGLFHVTQDGRLYIPTLLKEKSIDPPKTSLKEKLDERSINHVINKPFSAKNNLLQEDKKNEIEPKQEIKTKLDWWKSPAGWAKKGREQAISINKDESLEDFKLRVCLRLGEGEHTESLTERHKKKFDAEIKKGKEIMSKA